MSLLEINMNSTACCAETIHLTRPWHERLLDSAADGLKLLQAAWRRRAERRKLERDLDALADMDELLLRDIGAPDWLIGQAAVRRDSDRQRLMELQAGRHVEY
jgi:hypothetical protein